MNKEELRKIYLSENYKNSTKLEKKRIKKEAKETIPSDLEDIKKRYKIFQGDIRNLESLKKEIEPESIDWIITDPPYPKEYIPLIKNLKELREYALKPDGGIIIMIGQSYLPDVFKYMESDILKYCWTLSYLTPGGQSPYNYQRKSNAFWKPLLYYRKDMKSGDSFGDVIKTTVNNNDKNHHFWGQSIEGFDMILDKLTYPGEIILDPFLGGGTTAISSLKKYRSFVGFDIEESNIIVSENRIKELISIQ